MRPTRLAAMVMLLLLVSLALCSFAIAGAKAYDAADLSGTFAFTSQQVRMEYPPGGSEQQPNYCSGYGTLSFDGASMVAAISSDRCSLTGSTTDTMTMHYTVSPDGTVLITDLYDTSAGAHCKIVDRERMLICDGTYFGPDTLSFYLVAVQE